jgi:AcrR family transcriptional regulator
VIKINNFFNELNDEKRQRIIDAAIEEFSQHGYENSSTNRIVKNAQIAKGSLFKYFYTKEDLYFYVLDYVVSKLISEMGSKIGNLPGDAYERIIMYSELEFEFLMSHPKEYQFFRKAFNKDGTEIYKKTEAKYSLVSNDFYYRLLEGANNDSFKWDTKKALEIIKWVLKGYNEEFIDKTPMDEDLDEIKKNYSEGLRGYLNIIKDLL